MVSTKDRRHSGREMPTIYDTSEFPYERTFWNEWNDPRDGMRDRRKLEQKVRIRRERIVRKRRQKSKRNR